MTVDQRQAEDFEDMRLNKVAQRMREVFFEEFGEVESMTPQQVSNALRGMIGLHAGELIEAAARFKRETASVRETAIAYLDAMLAANEAEIAEILGQNEPVIYLVGAHEALAENDNASIPAPAAEYTGMAWEIAKTLANLWGVDHEANSAILEAGAARLQRFRDSGAASMRAAAVNAAQNELHGVDAAKLIQRLSIRSPFGREEHVAHDSLRISGHVPSVAEVMLLQEALEDFVAAQNSVGGNEVLIAFERLRRVATAFLAGTLEGPVV